MQNALLKVEALSVSLSRPGQERRLLKDITFSLAPNYVNALVGFSGSGKSMLGLALLDLLPAGLQIVSGNITFRGRSVLQYPGGPNFLKKLRGQSISMIFQEPQASLNPVLTVESQFLDVLRQNGNTDKKAAREEAKAWLEQCELNDPQSVLALYPHQLSGGMAQRVLIAMALCRKPSLLIADEPTTALDVSTQNKIMRLLQNLQQKHGFSILLISHDLPMVSRLAEKILVMENGQIVEHASTKTLLNSPASETARQLLHTYAPARRLRTTQPQPQ